MHSIDNQPENITLEKLFELNNQNISTIKKIDSSLLLGEVIDMMDPIPKNIKKIYLSPKQRAGHFGCIGTTRIGKTRLLSYMSSSDIKAGRSVIIVDPKGDTELLSSSIAASVEAGRLEEFMFISPIYPDYSIKIDPLAYYYIMDELVDHVISGIESKEKYFVDVAAEVTTAVLSYFIVKSKHYDTYDTINLYDIKKYIDYESLRQIKTEVFNLKDIGKTEEIRELAQDVYLMINHILNSPPDFFSKVSSSLRTILTQLTSSTTGKIIGKAKTNEFIKRFEEGKPVILYCNTGSLLARRTAHIIAKMLISMLQSAVGRALSSGIKINPPLCVYLDEGHNVLYRGIEELFNKSGGANVWVHFFTQSFAQMEEAIGHEITRSIIDNISTWIYMRVNHHQTVMEIEKSLPVKKIFELVISTGDARATFNLKEKQEKLFMAENIIKLKPRYFYLRNEGHFYKGIVPEVPLPWLNIQFPSVRVI